MGGLAGGKEMHKANAEILGRKLCELSAQGHPFPTDNTVTPYTHPSLPQNLGAKPVRKGGVVLGTGLGDLGGAQVGTEGSRAVLGCG